MIDWSVLEPEELLLRLREAAGSAQPYSSFLDCHQYASIQAVEGIHFSGGHPAAQFRCLSYSTLPELQYWSCARTDLPAELRSVRAIRQAWRVAGQAAWQLGDIIFGAEVCWIVCLPSAKLNIVLPMFDPGADPSPPLPAAEKLTAAGLRADAVVASLFKVSRGEAQTAIEYGFVFCNYLPLSRRTAGLKAGDQLVYRTKGRIELVGIEDSSKSGRSWISFRRYPC